MAGFALRKPCAMGAGQLHSGIPRLRANIQSMSCCDHDCSAPQTDTDNRYRRILWAALAINLAMFSIEIVASILANSVSLRADALDFLGDAANYAVALAVAGLALQWRARAALLKGSVMGLFGLWVAASTVYHAITATVPRAEVMGAIGFLALVANLAVASLLYRYRSADSQAMSVWLCTRNDCIANIAVIIAGAGVWASATAWPDVAVAAIIAYLGLSSAVRVIRQARSELREEPVLIGAPAK
jgi:Co/Zn/Cd efflux system component